MTIRRNDRAILMVVLMLVSSAFLAGKCTEVAETAEEDCDSDDAGCHPSEADTCFSEVNENLLCHLQTPKKRNCTERDAKDFCLSLDDALNCTDDIINSDCTEADGKLVFNNWLSGLQGAHARLCQEKDYVLLNNLLTAGNCWNLRTFVRCVENRANLTHIADLLTTELDQQECNLLQMAVSICNHKALKGRVKCRGKADAVNEAVAAFFSSSVCAGSTPAICNVLKPQKIVANDQSSSTAGISALAVFLTLVVTALLVALTTFVLVRRNVIIINTRFKMGRNSDGDQVEENRDDYGRFL